MNRASKWLIALPLFAIVLTAAFGPARTRLSAQEQAPADMTPRAFLPLTAGSPGAPGTAPLSVAASFDAARRVTGTIGPEGGSLSATAADGARFQLTLPPDALDWTETITITPASAIDHMPLSGGLIGAVDIQPAGLRLASPATLTIIPARPLAAPMALGFAFDGAGSEFHLVPTTAVASGAALQAADPPITMEIISIRPVGAGAGTRADVNAQAPRKPSAPIDALDQQLVERAGDRARQRDALQRYLEASVEPLVAQALADPSKVDAAVTAYLDWELRASQTGNSELVVLAILSVRDLVRALTLDGDRAAERCYSQHRPEEGFRLLRYAGYARKLMDAPLSAAMTAKLKKCLVFSVQVHSTITEGGFGSPYGYAYELETALTLRWTSRTRVTGSAPLTAVDLRWIGSSTCTADMALTPTTFDAESGEFGLVITPVSRSSPDVNVRFAYSPGAPREQTTFVCDGVPPIHWETSAWADYYAQMHAEERVGAGFVARSQAASMRTFGGWTYTHTTSGPSGQAVRESTEIDVVHTPER